MVTWPLSTAVSSLWSVSHRSNSEKLSEIHLGKQNHRRTYQVSWHPNALKTPLCKKVRGKEIIGQLYYMGVVRRNRLKFSYENTDVHIQDKEENISKAILIWRAIKLPMYSVALIPLTVGSAAAFWQTGHFCGKRYLTLLVSSILIIAWLNLSNDVYDFDKGADKNKKESVVNLVGSWTGTLVIACLLLALGTVGLVSVSIESGNVRAVLLLLYAIFCGYIYQGPPFRLGYIGLGEPLCFAAFGPFATTAFYLLQRGMREVSLSWTLVSSSILVGFTTSLILFCSHFHQVEDDRAVGKYSPLVRLGIKAGAKVVKAAVIALYSLLFVLGLSHLLPFSCVILGVFTLPIGNLLSTFVENNHKDKSMIFMAKYYSVRLHFIFGVALAAGLVAARLLVRKQLPHAIIL